jgi:5'-nucleotidase/UDP-sugar diphosphatase
MKVFKRLMVLSILTCFLLSSTIVFAETYHLTILHTNDHHGHFMKFNPYPVSDVGGLAAQSTLVNIVRAEVEDAGGAVLVLSAGDLNTGVPESDMLGAEPDIMLMNMIGYDAMTLGNHEFDKPREALMKQQEWADFPFLSANIVNKESGEPFVTPYIIKEYDGLKVAIFGLTTEESPAIVTPGHVEDLEFKNAIETAQALVPKLREEADVVIALTHLGVEGGYGYSGYDSTGDVEVAEAVPGIDVIVGGHSHTTLTEPVMVGNTMIVQAGDWSRYVGRVDLTIDSDVNKVTDSAYTLIPVNMKKRVRYNDNAYFMYVAQGYLEDGAILEAMQPYLEQADSVLDQALGEALVKLDGARELVRSGETNLGNLITDGMRAKTGVDIALMNGGGIRSDIAPGMVSYRDVLTVQPFGNTLVTMNLTGAQIMDVLNYAATIQPGQGAFLHVSGLTWTLNRAAGKAENVMVGDAPLDLNKTYSAVTNSFMAGGGDGYTMLKDVAGSDTGFVDADALREYIVNQGKVEPTVEGRLMIVE